MSVPPARIFVVAADRRNRPSAGAEAIDRAIVLSSAWDLVVGRFLQPEKSRALVVALVEAEPLATRRNRQGFLTIRNVWIYIVFPGVTESGAVPGRTASSKASTLGFAMNWANSSRDEFATARSPGRVALTPRSLWRSGDDQGASPAMRPPSRLPLDRPEQKANNPGVDDRDCLAFYPFVVVRIACRVCSRRGCAIFTT